MFACNRNCRIIYWNELTDCHNEDPFPNRKKTDSIWCYILLTLHWCCCCMHGYVWPEAWVKNAFQSALTTIQMMYWPARVALNPIEMVSCLSFYRSVCAVSKWRDIVASLTISNAVNSSVSCVVMHSAYNYDDSSYGNISNWYLFFFSHCLECKQRVLRAKTVCPWVFFTDHGSRAKAVCIVTHVQFNEIDRRSCGQWIECANCLHFSFSRAIRFIRQFLVRSIAYHFHHF